jgi:hypothetical protein
MQFELNPNQIEDLARPLMGIVEKFYEDPKNKEDFNKWLLSVEKSRKSAKTKS